MKISGRIVALLALFSVAILGIFNACVNPPSYPIIPNVEFISLSKDTLNRGDLNDTTFVKFSFTDGDGDIGSKDSLDLFITDQRDGTVRKLQIPFVPELGATNGVKGEITARMFTTCCIFPDQFLDGCNDVMASYPYDKVDYTIYLKDRAGHLSNTIQVAPIYIRCF